MIFAHYSIIDFLQLALQKQAKEHGLQSIEQKIGVFTSKLVLTPYPSLP